MVDDGQDVPASEQIRRRMEGQISGDAPAAATPMAMLGAVLQMRTELAEAEEAKANL